MTTQMIKTILFASLLSAIILPFTGMNDAFGERLTEDQRKLQDELGAKILRLKIDNQQLEMVGKSSTIPIIKANEREIESLFAQMDKLVPKLPIAEISDADMQKMEAAMDRLVESGLPLLTLNVNDSTGIFEVEVDIEKATNIDAEIMEIIGKDIPTEITYGVQEAYLQGACTGQSGDCDPIIGGSFAEEGGIAQDCTLTIADTKGSDNVMVTVHHCNPSHNDMWQNQKNGGAGDYMGPHHTASSDSECDCDLYEVSSRSINQNWLN